MHVVVYTHIYVLLDCPRQVYFALLYHISSVIRLYICIVIHTYAHMYGLYPHISMRMLKCVLIRGTTYFTLCNSANIFFNYVSLAVIARYTCFVYQYIHHSNAISLRILLSIGALFVLIFVCLLCICFPTDSGTTGIIYISHDIHVRPTLPIYIWPCFIEL